jgi:hypothetical protein
MASAARTVLAADHRLRVKTFRVVRPSSVALLRRMDVFRG